ncbi:MULTISPECIES: hypothetical protein [unclassified Aeromicrobium]|uniref:hypothetical protein n=1 Tax=unclassified Aeromicrobium TaxID=2633570 RepID=UPI00288A3B42|nr:MULTISPECIES: hypothetical protein [unclassified Aeromicrobium]
MGELAESGNRKKTLEVRLAEKADKNEHWGDGRLFLIALGGLAAGVLLRLVKPEFTAWSSVTDTLTSRPGGATVTLVVAVL